MIRSNIKVPKAETSFLKQEIHWPFAEGVLEWFCYNSFFIYVYKKSAHLQRPLATVVYKQRSFTIKKVLTE